MTASLPNIDSILLQVRLRWTDHVTRIEDMPMSKEVFFNEFQERKRGHGGPKKRYKDQLKRHLAQAGISHQSCLQKASDRDSRHSSVRKASRKFEAETHKAAKGKTLAAETARSFPIFLSPNFPLSKVR